MSRRNMLKQFRALKASIIGVDKRVASNKIDAQRIYIYLLTYLIILEIKI